jgi:hypothetical protein
MCAKQPSKKTVIIVINRREQSEGEDVELEMPASKEDCEG